MKLSGFSLDNQIYNVRCGCILRLSPGGYLGVINLQNMKFLCMKLESDVLRSEFVRNVNLMYFHVSAQETIS